MALTGGLQEGLRSTSLLRTRERQWTVACWQCVLRETSLELLQLTQSVPQRPPRLLLLLLLLRRRLLRLHQRVVLQRLYLLLQRLP